MNVTCLPTAEPPHFLQVGFGQEQPHDIGHAEKGREGHNDDALRSLTARLSLAIDIQRRLFVIPDAVKRLALPLQAPLFISLEPQERFLSLHIATTAPAYNHAIEPICDTAPHDRVLDAILGNCACAPSVLLSGRPDQ